ncbi:hypothetical protein KC19_1G215400 [Ceratodon purpureus]|uniref:Hexosyltransferase n=1 Tax=Ceratodon purpureus TaxID=3225 RepID=A0A8T0JAK5_CERPU|nr:hypothetical protein KC19_1G215400 [Ceratodon purpureus]
MEENWKEKLWERSRDRIAETYRDASSLCVGIMIFLRTSIIGHVGKDMLNRAKRKYELRNSFKHIKLRQFVTRLRMGRLGYLFLFFAAIGTLAVPLMFQDRLPQQVDQEFERAINIRQHAEREMDDSFTRSIKLAKEKNLIHDEGKASLDMSGYQPGFITKVPDKKANVNGDVAFEGKNTAMLTSEDVKLSDPVEPWRKPDQLESGLIESHNARKSDVSTSEERTGRQHKTTPSKSPRHRRHKFKRRSSLDPFHALMASAETVSSNMAPPVAHSAVDTVGLPTGFTEAFEEVLKLASEANKTAEEKPAELQEESSITQLLPTDKAAELDVGSQKLLKEKSGLSEDPLKENDKSQSDNLLQSKENLPESKLIDETKVVADESKAVVDETKVVADETKAAADETKIVADESKAVVDETKVVADETKAAADETKVVADESKAIVDETKAVADETKAAADETEVVADESKAVVDETKVVADETKAAADETEVVADESKAVVDETKAVADETKAAADESKAVVDETKAVADVKAVFSKENPNDGVVGEQVLQTEVRQENSGDWSQESALISSLKQRAASGTLNVGLLNIEAKDLRGWEFLAGETSMTIPFERVNEKVGWNDLYPEWIDEEEKYGTPECPSLPMPKVSSEVKLDVVIVRAPCTASSALQEGWKHPASLQVLLGAASLAVKAGNENAYVLILSECRPLVNLFTCEELLEHRDQGWLYQVNSKQLEQRISLPVGSCELSVSLRQQETSLDTGARKDAYATILHSGGDYVCGAIATAHSIRKTGSTKDLVILVDSSISPEHRQALKEAGWKVRDFERIYTTNTVDGKQFEKDFSKFRLWQLSDYNKVVYVEADILVLRNLDHLFMIPEVSGSGSAKTLFNSGVMVIEPSNCTYQLLMDEMEKVASQIGGDWDFLNRMFPWWHRIPRHMNYLKYFWTRQNNEDQDMNRLFSSDPPQLYAIHYWGYKPWQCFRDYDCNWNVNQQFASDEAHNQWFKVYDDMPGNLQKHCALSTGTKAFLEHNRRKAKAAGFADQHWAINITDPRLNLCQESHCDWNALLSLWEKSTNSVAA